MATWLRIGHGRAPAILVTATILAALLVACGGGDDDDGDSASVADPATLPTTVTVMLKDNAFSPSLITVAAEKEITFEVKNEGGEVHNMSVKLDGKDTASSPDVIRSDQEGKLVVTFARAGTYDFKCDFHPVEMIGKITVE